MRNSIWVTFQREGFHQYLDAPNEVKYLRDVHRHMFHFRVELEVKTLDRDLEFHMVQKNVTRYLDSFEWDHRSCEQIADLLIENLQRWYPGREVIVEVSEDGECGAKVHAR